ncbi:MAG: NAD(P)H-dependent glycerol-3-phosphate dehydrogenase, partial [Halomonadaceae bacterium]
QHITLWMRDEEQARYIREHHENQRYLPGIELSQHIHPSTCLKESISQADVVFVALPSKVFRQVIHESAHLFPRDQIVISTTKGIEKKGFKLMSEVLEEEIPQTRVGVLSGPNLAAEMVRCELTASVIASPHDEVRETVQALLGCDYFRVYANVDTYGVELGGALKNIYAIISGLAAARGMGENTKSMLITRSLAEMSRFAVSLGANPMTFMGLAGVGDLIVTCTSDKSRNYRVGYALGQGATLEDAVSRLGQVAEGAQTLLLVKEKAEELGVPMPLVRGLYEILYNKASITDVVNALMSATQNSDVEFILPRQ